VRRRRRRQPARGAPRRTSRWRSSGWPAATRAGSRRRSSCGSWWPPAGTRSPGCRPIAAGTWSGSTTRIPTTPAPCTRAAAGSWSGRGSSTPGSSGSARARRWPWTRSSG
jgi:hypothetical protein